MQTQTSTPYALGSSAPELSRLHRQSDALAGETEWLFDQVDVQPGWRVLDVGCGPGGVLDALARRVGREGSVVGLDASATMVAQARAFAAERALGNVEIVQADAGDPGLPLGSFDFVHARLLLVNLPPALVGKVVAAMVALARPGGVVALQDIDAGSFACDPPLAAWNKLFDAFTGVAGEGKVGRRLPRILRDAGAAEIQHGAHAMFCPPGHVWRTLVLQFSDLTRARVLQLGLAGADELDTAKAELTAHLADPRTSVLAPVLVQVWGRAPTRAQA